MVAVNGSIALVLFTALGDVYGISWRNSVKFCRCSLITADAIRQIFRIWCFPSRFMNIVHHRNDVLIYVHSLWSERTRSKNRQFFIEPINTEANLISFDIYSRVRIMSLARCARRSLKSALQQLHHMDTSHTLFNPSPNALPSRLSPLFNAAAERSSIPSPSQFINLRGFASQPRRHPMKQSETLRRKISDQGMYLVRVLQCITFSSIHPSISLTCIKQHTNIHMHLNR